MTELLVTVLVPLVVGIVVNDITEASPWLARHLVRWAAHRRYSDPTTRAERAEEWTALIDERPGKFLKLLTAAPFAAVALARPRHGRHAAAVPRRRLPLGLAVAAAAVVLGLAVNSLSQSGIDVQEAEDAKTTIDAANAAIGHGDLATAKSLV